MSFSKNVDFEILKVLECAGCRKYMTSSTTTCENWQSTCSNCSSSVSECPTCSGTSINNRYINLQKVATLLLYPCRYRETGCRKTLTVATIIDHQNLCYCTGNDCPFKNYGALISFMVPFLHWFGSM